MGSSWKLPVVYIIEDNLFMVSTRTADVMNIDDLSCRAVSYGIPGVAVDGNDVVAVYNAAKELVARTREGGGLSFLECRTYRWHGHFETKMPVETRPAEEVEAWKKKCPVTAMERRLLEAGISTEQDIKEIHNQVMERIEDAVRYAVESPFPDPEDALDDVYADNTLAGGIA